MLVGIDYGRKHLDLKVQDDSLVKIHRNSLSPPVSDLAAAVRKAVESPIGFPALKRALTPDDHVAIVVDDRLPCRAELLAPILEHVAEANVRSERITIVHRSKGDSDEWSKGVPPSMANVHFEVHDPANRKKLSYLATTRAGRRIYLNRTAVDADQLVVVAGRRYDPVLGYSGAEGAIYPGLSDEATQQLVCGHLSLVAPEIKPWSARKEAAEVAWLLGSPFAVEVIEGPGDDVLHVIAGTTDVANEGIDLLNAAWRVSVDSLADVVVAAISGDADRHTFADLAAASASAARVVKPQGRIVLLTSARAMSDESTEFLHRAQDPEAALKLVKQAAPSGMAAAYQWASAANRATIYLLSDVPHDTAENWFAIPLENVEQLQRLLDSPGSRLFLSDAHKTLAVGPATAKD